MKKLFVLTEASKKYRVENLWYFFAKDPDDLANQLIEDSRYLEIMTNLGGDEWNYLHRRYRQPSPSEVLKAMDDSFGEDYHYQLFELSLEEPQQFQAPEVRHGRLVFPYNFKHPQNALHHEEI